MPKFVWQFGFESLCNFNVPTLYSGFKEKLCAFTGQKPQLIWNEEFRPMLAARGNDGDE
ncbi:MAG: hypothetical protein N3B10_06465 [Armatimonadetes bacterium]|nr:hypothetical protein [Armatimonadota bacterium]MCX7968120.1 hypothetical protein [Armatimonadota bacterium]MDW8143142.1 hypothetical protein [Armatimonadota bacterium]